MQRAVRMAASSEDWVRIAADAGYYDQSHLIADFRELIGLTPGTFLKRAGGRGLRDDSGEAAIELHGTTERREIDSPLPKTRADRTLHDLTR